MPDKSNESKRRAARVRWDKTPAGDDAIKRLVAAAPRLTEAQKAQIRALLGDAPESSAATQPPPSASNAQMVALLIKGYKDFDPARYPMTLPSADEAKTGTEDGTEPRSGSGPEDVAE